MTYMQFKTFLLLQLVKPTCRSLAITDSMSSPTYPACVKAVQSHIVNGTSRQRAIVCANSVLPEKKKTVLESGCKMCM